MTVKHMQRPGCAGVLGNEDSHCVCQGLTVTLAQIACLRFTTSSLGLREEFWIRDKTVKWKSSHFFRVEKQKIQK